MASLPHGPERERASVPRIVLPITARGLEVTDRLCWWILGAAMAAATALILYVSRGTTFFLDELSWVYATPTLGADDVLDPHNGHLIATTRLAYKAILETIGADYVAFRLLGVSSVVLSGALFYALVKRRIGALPALAPAIVLLFFGSAEEYVGTPIGFATLLSIAAGLAALLALERGDRRGDVAACVLIALSVASFSTGLAFLVGVAISVLVRPDRWERLWIFLVPLVLYGAWWLSSLDSPGSVEGQAKLSNVLLIPSYVADALAAATAALAGLDYDFVGSGEGVALGWGYVLAVIAVVALAVRISRGNVPRSLWVSLAIVLAVWTGGALAAGLGRDPESARYVYMGAVGVLLVATDAARSIRLSKLGIAVLFGACAVSLATNVALLRDWGTFFRDSYSAPARAEFAMLELSRERVDPDFDPGAALDESVLALPGARAGTYFAVVDRYGSLALPLPELERESESIRAHADQTLASALGLRLESPPAGPRAACRELRGTGPAGPIEFELPAAGATLRARGVAPANLSVGRFATSPSAELGNLPPGRALALAIPPDSSPTPWLASVSGAESIEVCALR
jgi:hypothetical protein